MVTRIEVAAEAAYRQYRIEISREWGLWADLEPHRKRYWHRIAAEAVHAYEAAPDPFGPHYRPDEKALGKSSPTFPPGSMATLEDGTPDLSPVNRPDGTLDTHRGNS